MATFNINLPNSFVNGTAANDTFNINASLCHGVRAGRRRPVLGRTNGGHSLDGGAGNDSFSLGSIFNVSSRFRRRWQ